MCKLSADFFTQDTLENPVNDNGDMGMYMSPSTRRIGTDVTWTVNGAPVVPVQDLTGLDFNNDGAVTSADGQRLLDYATGINTTLTNQDKADLDADGDIDTHHAWLLLSKPNAGTAMVPANGSVEVTVTVTLTGQARRPVIRSPGLFASGGAGRQGKRRKSTNPP